MKRTVLCLSGNSCGTTISILALALIVRQVGTLRKTIRIAALAGEHARVGSELGGSSNWHALDIVIDANVLVGWSVTGRCLLDRGLCLAYDQVAREWYANTKRNTNGNWRRWARLDRSQGGNES